MSKGTCQGMMLLADALIMSGRGKEAANVMQLRSDLLINGGKPPIPSRILNQRQKRKRTIHH